MELKEPLTNVKGIGEKSEKLFNKLGIFTVRDLLNDFPRDYEEYPEVMDLDEVLDYAKESEVNLAATGLKVALVGRAKTPVTARKTRRVTVITATYFSSEKAVECVWFNNTYIMSSVKVDEVVVLYGILKTDGYRYKIEQPNIYTVDKYNSFRYSYQPVYHLTKGLKNQNMRNYLRNAIDKIRSDGFKDDYLPAEIISKYDFVNFMDAVEAMHFPSDFKQLKAGRDRLVFQEFFYFILNNALQQSKEIGEINSWKFEKDTFAKKVLDNLPFELTKGQKNAIEEIKNDLKGEYVSQRLIQGDVGSGKTVVAFLSMVLAAENGYQSAIMAPTEVLARQHEEGFKKMVEDFGLDIQVVCLTGSMTAKQKREAYEVIEHTPGIIIVGTHALIQEKVVYNDLALVITDEQHRFGVKQREYLGQKGKKPHMVVMSATPIPRTLALILYGNMQISVIKDMPAKRLPIKTAIIKENLRKNAYNKIALEIEAGHQAYIICPLVESSESSDSENVVDYVEKINKYYGGKYTISPLHGKMKPKEKNDIMNAFAAHEIDILVSTTVVEVGINVPNATIIMIEDANRFGLAQLHQLRGRVGRGDAQSYCVLMDKSKGKEIIPRLKVLGESTDGFYIAEQDLKLRGPGDFFGVRQSGEFNFKIADIIGDSDMLKKASTEVNKIISADPTLINHTQLKLHLNSFVEDNNMIL
ncbi:MAG: ATP-dependent DNA helicase RecG [Lachnospiraceae bacterium]|nr:ATP-dependent DNA helicase RecG [Lachnospiraceae bacterium]